MVDWREILRRRGPREDAGESFYADSVDHERPVLLNEAGPLAAAFVAARLLRAVAVRRGTKVRPGIVERLERLLARGLTEEVRHHCEAEAERILTWLDEPAADGAEDLSPGGSRTPELDMMMAADLESRLSVANFALDEGYDLELEYFDEDAGRWPRVRAAIEDVEGGDAADFETALVLRADGREFDVSLKSVRWLMPVPAKDDDPLSAPSGGDVLPFPTPDGGE